MIIILTNICLVRTVLLFVIMSVYHDVKGIAVTYPISWSLTAVYWIENASWVADGKFYSSSSSVYGIDMALGAVADLVDIDSAWKAANEMGYTWNQEMGVF